MNTLLMKALKNKFDMSADDARELTKTVESVFNGNAEIEDMSIDKHVRSIFYELQREKLLKLRREEIKEKGKIIRKFFWSFDTDSIKHGAHYQQVFDDSPEALYKRIPRNAWLLHSANT
ncbi:MAG: hypothetical protein KKC68_00685 [Candidatus Thermoplasmatota archaeon]|nr:hypothetical protein [Candidatus Thermoplasmatota archaeon]MBU1940267.1 hypothetical protein [Candidatus Thermoplasmatota archaeon]